MASRAGWDSDDMRSLSKFSQQARDASVAAGGFDAGPAGDVFLESHGDIAEAPIVRHETSVTRS